tara:strand:- start:144 stop:548 length:405 start_codon:yes stop_codon:yes gene_type:complete
MICRVSKNGWINYPYSDLRVMIPSLVEWSVRSRSNCLSSVMRNTLSKDLIAVRAFVYKGESGGGEQVFYVCLEYKERGMEKWSVWTNNKMTLPQKVEMYDDYLDMNSYPSLQDLRVAVKEDISHLMTFFGATFV